MDPLSATNPLGPNPEWVYIANSDSDVRYPYKSGDLTASGKSEKIIERIPWVHHWTRDIVFSPDGKRLLLSVGSGSNVALDMFSEPLIKGQGYRDADDRSQVAQRLRISLWVLFVGVLYRKWPVMTSAATLGHIAFG